jgi:hypothetical protein
MTTQNKKTKSIAYAYPYSKLADDQGFSGTGCYYIKTGLLNIENSGQANFSPDYQIGFFDKINQDLLDSFHESDGEPCKMSLKYNSHFYSLA